jgi:predicted dehydrogenase
MRHPRFEVAAVCDTRPDRATLLAHRAGGVPAYADWRELLDREQVDAAVLTLPPEASPDVAIGCLRRGWHVLDEKPLAATLEDGRRVARAAVESGRVFQVGFVLRYGDLVRQVTRLAHAIGTPSRTRVSIHDERLDRSNVEHLGRIQGFLRHSSALTHEGSHVIDYAGLWNPSPWTSVRARAERTAPDFAGPNHWQATVRLADGSSLEVEISWLLPDLPPSTVTIEGPNGRLDLDLLSGAGEWQIGGDVKRLSLPPMAPEWDRQYDAFAAAIDRGVATEATIEDGLRTLEVTVACEESHRANAEIGWHESLPGKTLKERSRSDA